MGIRVFEQYDIPVLLDLLKHYEKEFTVEDVLDPHAVQLFSITNHDGNIMGIGGIRNILEIITVLNYDVSLKERREAGHNILEASIFTANRLGYRDLHAYVQDDKFIKHLNRLGFRDTKGKSLVMNV